MVPIVYFLAKFQIFGIYTENNKGGMHMLHVGLLYTEEKQEDKSGKFDPHGAAQMTNTVKDIEESILKKGHRVTLIPASLDLLQKIEAIEDLDVIFNSCTGITDKIQQANVVAMLELQKVPFVGSGLSTQILGLHKAASKRLFKAANIPTARFQVFRKGTEQINENLRYPLMVKPDREGSSLGIDHDSVVHDDVSLYKKVKEIIKIFKQPALVEEFLEGREFTVGIIGNSELEVLPIIEILYDDVDSDVMTVDLKAEDQLGQKLPADLDEETLEIIKNNARKAFTVLECNDFARIDVRMDSQGSPHFIEINTLPGMEKGYSDFPKMAEAKGYKYEDLIEKLIMLAVERGKKEKSHG